MAVCGLATSVKTQAQATQHEWKATLKVTDEIGRPLGGVNTKVYYLSTNAVVGLTDTNGVFIASHHDGSENLTFEAAKEGYYPFRLQYHLGRRYSLDKWNKVQSVILKKIGKPIPMYARNARIEIPSGENSLGFDLIAYDWVAPYGKGKQADLIFCPKRRWVSRNDFDASITITFANKGDGLAPVSAPPNQGSKLRLAAIAPLDSYISSISKTLSNTPANGWIDNERNGNNGQNYYFRIRTVLDGEGNVKSALYGKIYDDFALDPINSKTVKIFFTYYLNPEANSRNVEFDTEHNLFKNLSPRELVEQP